jgi:hypothetical protein
MYTCPVRGHWRPRSNHHQQASVEQGNDRGEGERRRQEDSVGLFLWSTRKTFLVVLFSSGVGAKTPLEKLFCAELLRYVT